MAGNNPTALLARADRDASLMDAMTEAFARELAQVLRLLNGELRRLVGTLQTTRDRVIASRANLARVVRAKRDIASAIERAGYTRLMAAAVDAPLDRLAERILAGDALANAAVSLTAVDIDALVALKDVRLAQLLGLGADLEAAIWRITLDGVLGARSVTDLIGDLADIVDVSARQAHVLYDTAVSTYSRAAGLLGSDGTPDELFLYVGPVDSKTRPFCLDHVGKVYTREAIDALDNGIKGFPNVLLSGGGPNCRHRFQRVSKLSDLRDLANTDQRVPHVQTFVDSLAEAA